jgi:dihydrofolate synthase/folylpolyglutamate synthase
MDYNSALNIINAKKSLGIMPGLERINVLLGAMDNPQDKLKIIHIAGTNGKGTVAKTIADVLQKNGFKTGLFTSPWVTDYREQIQINGELISENALADYTEKYGGFLTTEFEFITAAAYKYFADSAVDYAVIECGMGGRGDATNVEKHNVLSVITAVSLDHMDYFGGTVRKIAEEKSGIIRADSACVLYPNPGCESVFESKCKELNTKLIKARQGSSIDENNLNTVNAALEYLGIEKTEKLSKLPARQEVISDVLLDGGHNPDAAAALAPRLNSEVALIGMLADKDVDAYLSQIAPHCSMIIATQPDSARALPAHHLKAFADKYCTNVVAVAEPKQAFDFARAQGLTLICGSFYLIREVRKELL